MQATEQHILARIRFNISITFDCGHRLPMQNPFNYGNTCTTTVVTSNMLHSGCSTSIYYMPKWNQAFSLVKTTVQYFLAYCTVASFWKWHPKVRVFFLFAVILANVVTHSVPLLSKYDQWIPPPVSVSRFNDTIDIQVLWRSFQVQRHRYNVYFHCENE